MKTIIPPNLNRQRGAATLLIALVLLIGITLVTLITSKTVLVETQTAADNYRTSQAVAAANAAMDYGVAYFNGNSALVPTVALPIITGLDHNANLAVDYTSAAPCYLNLTTGLCTGVATESAQMSYNNNIASCTTANNMKGALITAIGYSDDRLGKRTITQCVGTIDVFGGNAPKQPLVSQGNVALTGNYNIINRYTDINIWAGSAVGIGSSASAATYIRTVGTALASLTTAQLMASTTANTTGPISSNGTGAGLDIIASDPGLGTLTDDEFFENFFLGTRTEMKGMAIAAGTYYTGANIANAAGKSGIIWIEGDASLTGLTIGSLNNPAIVIVNGNLDVAGNPNIYGMLYVVGQMDAAGTLSVFGSSVVEGNAAMVPAGQDPVIGNGTVNLVYTPATLDQPPAPILGTTAIVSGSWRDW